MSEKLEQLIQQHQNNWSELAEDYERLRAEAIEGRTDTIDGLTREASTFFDHVTQLAYGDTPVPEASVEAVKQLMTRIIEMLQDTIDVLDFWRKPIEVKKLRGNIATEILLADVAELTAVHERIAVEIVKLAQKRHEELTR